MAASTADIIGVYIADIITATGTATTGITVPMGIMAIIVPMGTTAIIVPMGIMVIGVRTSAATMVINVV